MLQDSASLYIENYKKKTNLLLDNIILREVYKFKNLGSISNVCVSYLESILKKGKRLRGALLTLGYNLGTNFKVDANIDVYTYSLAIEVFHTAMLIHDDIMDRSTKRRGINSAHTFFKSMYIKDKSHMGEATAICLGDFLLLLSHRLLMNTKTDARTKTNVIRVFQNTTEKLTFGQIEELNLSSKIPRKRNVTNIMWIKSGQYSCQLPLSIGLKLSGTNFANYKYLHLYSRCLGYLFQLRDDYLGIFGDEHITGKSVFSDIREGKINLYTYKLLRTNSLSQIFGRKNATNVEVQQIRDLLNKNGTIKDIQKISNRTLQKGIGIIPKITSCKKSQHLLKSFLELAIQRNY